MPVLIFVLADCPACGRRNAAMPNSVAPGQWQVFPRDTRDFAHPTHLCSGDLMCLKGHRLRVTRPAAVLAETGAWVPVGASPRWARAN